MTRRLLHLLVRALNRYDRFVTEQDRRTPLPVADRGLDEHARDEQRRAGRAW